MRYKGVIIPRAIPTWSAAAIVMVPIGFGEAQAAELNCAIYREDAVTLPQGKGTPPKPSAANAQAAEICAEHFAVRLAADPATAKGAVSLVDSYVVSVGPKGGSAIALKAAAPPLFSAGVDGTKRDLKDVDFQIAEPSPAQSASPGRAGTDQQPSSGGPPPPRPRPRFFETPEGMVNGQSLYRMRLGQGNR